MDKKRLKYWDNEGLKYCNDQHEVSQSVLIMSQNCVSMLVRAWIILDGISLWQIINVTCQKAPIEVETWMFGATGTAGAALHFCFQRESQTVKMLLRLKHGLQTSVHLSEAYWRIPRPCNLLMAEKWWLTYSCFPLFIQASTSPKNINQAAPYHQLEKCLVTFCGLQWQSWTYTKAMLISQNCLSICVGATETSIFDFLSLSISFMWVPLG
jgi:hypothetical protein